MKLDITLVYETRIQVRVLSGVLEMPACTKCGKTKRVSAFNWNGYKARLEYHCRACHSDYTHDHYIKNKQYYKNKAARRRRELQDWMAEQKSILKCSRCVESHAACLEFHHTDPTQKDENLSTAVNRGWSVQRLISEIEKCEVVCSNCHRKLHYEEHLRGEADITAPPEGAVSGSIPDVGTVVGATAGV